MGMLQFLLARFARMVLFHISLYNNTLVCHVVTYDFLEMLVPEKDSSLAMSSEQGATKRAFKNGWRRTGPWNVLPYTTQYIVMNTANIPITAVT
jgi:hypothetical protein